MASRNDSEQAIYIISVAAELAGVHPQTLRVYERKGLIRPQRTEGNTRRYSEKDIARLKRIQELSRQGVNLAGVLSILELEEELDKLRKRYERALAQITRLEQDLAELIEARGRTALVPMREVRRIRRALKSDDLEQASKRRTFAAPPVGGTG